MEFKVFYWEQSAAGVRTYYDASNQTKTALPESFEVPYTQDKCFYRNSANTIGFMICNIQSIVKDGYTYEDKTESNEFLHFEQVHVLYNNLKDHIWIVKPAHDANSLNVYFNKADRTSMRHILHTVQAQKGMAAIRQAQEILNQAIASFRYIINT